MSIKNEYEAVVDIKTFDILPNYFPEALKTPTGYSTSDNDYRSLYTKGNTTVCEVSLNRVITKALYRAIQATLYDDIYTGFAACDDGTHSVGEYQLIKDFTVPDTDEKKAAIAAAPYALCVYNSKDGTFMLGEGSPDDKSNIKKLELVKTDNLKDTTIMVYAMMPFFLDDSELEDTFKILVENYKESLDNPTSPAAAMFAKAMYVANDNIYARLKTKNDPQAGKNVVVKNNASGKISAATLNSGSYVATTEERRLVFFGADAAPKKTKAFKGKTINELRGMYAIPNIAYTPEEELLIPVMPDNTVISEEALEIAKMIRDSSSLKHPKRNYCLFGPSGLGKTTITQQVAVLLGMPYIIQGCNADTDASDLVVQAVPVSTEEMGDRMPKMPNAMTIAMNPKKAYFDITGEEKTDATEVDCFKAFAALCAATSGNTAKVRYEKANIIKGITRPYLVEVQEPSTMQKQGALTVLNSLLDDCRQITLPSGEVIYRDPNSVVIMTTNMGYEGTRDLNQSVLSRCRKVNVKYPEKDGEIVDFLLMATDMKDKDALKKMVKVFTKVRTQCQDNGISQGSYGYRELIDWCDEAVLTSVGSDYDLMESCKKTLLISAAVNNEDDYNDLVEVATGVLNPKQQGG